MILKNLIFLLITTFVVTCNANNKVSTNDEYNLQNIAVKNFNFLATIVVVANNRKKSWVSKQRVVNTETINNLVTTKVENRDIENGKTVDIEEYWYDKGILVKYKNNDKIYTIFPGTKYKTMPKNAKIGDKGILPELSSNGGNKIKTSWVLKKKDNVTIYQEESVYYLNNTISEVIVSDYIIDNAGKILDFTFNYYYGNKVVHLITANCNEINYK